MKAQLYKNLMSIRLRLFFFLFIQLYVLIYLSGEYNLALGIFPFFLSGAISFNISYLEEKSKTDNYYDILPVKRSTVVSGQYIVLLMFNGVTFVLSAITRSVGLAIAGEHLSIKNIAELLPASLISIALVSVCFLAVFRFGYGKAMVVYVLICGIMGGLSGFCFSYGYDSFNDSTQGSLPFSELNGDTVKVYLIISLLSVILIAFSWLMSIKVYEKKEM